jgi:hypothetical protein
MSRQTMSRIEKLPAVVATVAVLAWLPAAIVRADHEGSEWNAPTPFPDRVVLTWSGDPATTQSVTWRTDLSVTTPRLQYAVASPGPGFDHDAVTVTPRSETVDASVVEGEVVVAQFHSATLAGLTPDTLYAYRVGDGGRWTEWFQFRTASTEPERFSFIYMGDAQNDILSHWSRTIRSGFVEAPDARFMLHAGDLINDAHTDVQWGEWFRAGGWLHAMVPSVPATGNHEFGALVDDEDADDELSLFWRPQFTLPMNGAPGLEETTYWLDYQGARIVVMDSNRDRDVQVEWLDRVLADNPNEWTVVTFHHPIFSTGSERDNRALRELWKPVLDRNGVDLVLQGHDHTYGRGRARNDASGVNLRDDEAGTVYVVSVSGPKMYEFTPEGWTPYPATLDRRAENTQLFQVITIDGDRLEYRSHTATGALYDAFDLVHGERGNTFVERMPADAPTRGFEDGPKYPYAERERGPTE